MINVLDPDVIVLGGGLSNLDRLYARVPRAWAPWVFSDRWRRGWCRPSMAIRAACAARRGSGRN